VIRPFNLFRYSHFLISVSAFDFYKLREMAALSKSFHGLPRFALCFSIFALLVLCALPSFVATAAEPKAAEPRKVVAAPPPAAPAAIPLADIATRATEVSNLIGNLTAGATPSAQIENIAKTLPEFSEKLDAQLAATTKSLEAEPTLETLQNEQQLWQSAQLQATGWLNALTLEATKLQDSLNRLAELQKLWSSTRASAEAAKTPVRSCSRLTQRSQSLPRPRRLCRRSVPTS
jgi:hypothetical protein